MFKKLMVAYGQKTAIGDEEIKEIKPKEKKSLFSQMTVAFGKKTALGGDESEDEQVNPFGKSSDKSKLKPEPSKAITESDHEESILGNLRGHENLVQQGKWTVDNIFQGQARDDVDVSSLDIFSLARHNRLPQLRKMVDLGVDPNSRDKNGNTILIIGAQNGNKAVVKLALRNGGDINATNCCGKSAFFYASEYKYMRLAQYLLRKGANPVCLKDEFLHL